MNLTRLYITVGHHPNHKTPPPIHTLQIIQATELFFTQKKKKLKPTAAYIENQTIRNNIEIPNKIFRF